MPAATPTPTADTATELPTPEPWWTYDDYIAAGYTLWSVEDFATRIGRLPQSLRKALHRRGEHIAADAARRGVPLEEGRPDTLDILEPACYREVRYTGFRPDTDPGMIVREPKWVPYHAIRWAQQMGKLKADGVTPIPPRSGNVAKE